MKVSTEILYNVNNSINGTVMPIFVTVVGVENMWLKWTINGGFIFYQVVNLLVLLVGFIFGIRGLILGISTQGIRPSTSQICLLFNSMAVVTIFLYVLDL